MKADRREFVKSAVAAGAAVIAGPGKLRAEAGPDLAGWGAAHRAQTDAVAAFFRAELDKLIAMKINSEPGRGPRLPHSVIPVGSIKTWRNMYYWDTFFTVRLLLDFDEVRIARNQVENCLYLIDRFGYVPNANRYEWASRSQPPLLSSMARLVLARDPDPDLLAACYRGLTREYEQFWLGPLHFVPAAGGSRYQDNGFHTARLLGYPRNRLSNLQAEAESGWDFTPRFQRRCLDHLPVDLNAFLYQYELDLSAMAGELKLGPGETAKWRGRAEARKARFAELFWDPARKFFFDYDYRNGKPSPVYSLAGYLPLWVGLADDNQAAACAAALPRFEHEFGLAVTDETYGFKNVQWNFPNAWPPANWWAAEGLRRYGFTAAADRIAVKYLSTQTRLFQRDGVIYEKFNAVTGDTDVTGGHERGTSAMLGWSAATYLDFLRAGR